MIKQQFMPIKNVRKKYKLLKTQSGLVLFIALIALVVMSLAAAALVRSVDSGVLVAGNLAFKQSALMSGDNGVSEAYRFVNVSTPAVLNTTNANGYSSQFVEIPNFKAAALWTDANSRTVPVDASDTTQNETRYVIQRMCRNAAVPDGTHCLMGDAASGANSKGGQCQGGCGSGGSGAGGQSGNSGAAVYRVTVRVTGPKNTVSYLQAFIY